MDWKKPTITWVPRTLEFTRLDVSFSDHVKRSCLSKQNNAVRGTTATENLDRSSNNQFGKVWVYTSDEVKYLLYVCKVTNGAQHRGVLRMSQHFEGLLVCHREVFCLFFTNNFSLNAVPGFSTAPRDSLYWLVRSLFAIYVWNNVEASAVTSFKVFFGH